MAVSASPARDACIPSESQTIGIASAAPSSSAASEFATIELAKQIEKQMFRLAVSLPQQEAREFLSLLNRFAEQPDQILSLGSPRLRHYVLKRATALRASNGVPFVSKGFLTEEGSSAWALAHCLLVRTNTRPIAREIANRFGPMWENIGITEVA